MNVRPIRRAASAVALAASAALAAVALARSASPTANLDDTLDPPLLLALEVDGASIPVELDRPFTLEPSDAPRSAVLRAEPFRVFPYAGIRFHFPRHMGFQADLAEPPPAWYLNGNDVLVIVQRHDDVHEAELLVDLFVAGMRSFVGSEASRVAGDASIELGEHHAEGKVLELDVAGVLQIQEVYALDHPDGGTVALILQDSTAFGGLDPAEFTEAKAMIAESFRFAADGD